MAVVTKNVITQILQSLYNFISLVKNLDKELGDDPEELDGIPDFDKSRSVTPVVEKGIN